MTIFIIDRFLFLINYLSENYENCWFLFLHAQDDFLKCLVLSTTQRYSLYCHKGVKYLMVPASQICTVMQISGVKIVGRTHKHNFLTFYRPNFKYTQNNTHDMWVLPLGVSYIKTITKDVVKWRCEVIKEVVVLIVKQPPLPDFSEFDHCWKHLG